jgi:hypothetical protein
LSGVHSTIRSMNKLSFFHKNQLFLEVAFVIGFFSINGTILATSVLLEAKRKSSSLPFEAWEPFLWEYTSAIAMMVLIPFIARFTRRYPINWQKVRYTLLIYLAASVVYSACHIGMMWAARKLVYWSLDKTYNLGNIPFELLYEYRKDLWSFIFFIAAIYSYRFIVSRLQGEANLISDGEETTSKQSCDRLLVKKLGKEFIIKVKDIEWLESSGNYVNLHIQGRIYPTRATLGKLIEQIDEKGFCRIHRSHGINLDAVDSITPLNSGDSEVRLTNGKVLNLSRRYKDQLKARLH